MRLDVWMLRRFHVCVSVTPMIRQNGLLLNGEVKLDSHTTLGVELQLLGHVRGQCADRVVGANVAHAVTAMCLPSQTMPLIRIVLTGGPLMGCATHRAIREHSVHPTASTTHGSTRAKSFSLRPKCAGERVAGARSFSLCPESASERGTRVEPFPLQGARYRRAGPYSRD